MLRHLPTGTPRCATTLFTSVPNGLMCLPLPLFMRSGPSPRTTLSLCKCALNRSEGRPKPDLLFLVLPLSRALDLPIISTHSAVSQPPNCAGLTRRAVDGSIEPKITIRRTCLDSGTSSYLPRSTGAGAMSMRPCAPGARSAREPAGVSACDGECLLDLLAVGCECPGVGCALGLACAGVVDEAEAL